MAQEKLLAQERKVFEQQASELIQQIMGNKIEWTKRNEAVVTLQTLVQGVSGPKVFSSAFWRDLKEPLTYTLNDLRSTLVREACRLIEVLSGKAGDAMRPLMRDMTKVMLTLVGNGNSTIKDYIDQCMTSVIAQTTFPAQLKDMANEIKTSKSADLREAVARYILLILQQWPRAGLDKEVAHLQDAVLLLLEDASNACRDSGRSSFVLFKDYWPAQAARIIESVDARTAKLLGVNTSGQTLTVATTPASHSSSQASFHLSRPASTKDVNRPPTPSGTHHKSGTSGASTSWGAADVPDNATGIGNGLHGMLAHGSSSSLSHLAAAPLNFHVGDKVRVGGGGQGTNSTTLKSPDKAGTVGIVRYIGGTQFATGNWVGVELDTPDGLNDGSVHGVSYFNCKPNHGKFVRSTQVEPIIEEVLPLNMPTAPVEPSPLVISAQAALRAHKVFVAQLLEALEHETRAIVTFEDAVGSEKGLQASQVTSYTTFVTNTVDMHRIMLEGLSRAIPTV